MPTIPMPLNYDLDLYRCQYPGCDRRRVGVLRADTYDRSNNAQSGISVSACLRHERHLSSALKLLGYDTEYILEPRERSLSVEA